MVNQMVKKTSSNARHGRHVKQTASKAPATDTTRQSAPRLRMLCAHMAASVGSGAEQM